MRFFKLHKRFFKTSNSNKLPHFFYSKNFMKTLFLKAKTTLLIKGKKISEWFDYLYVLQIQVLMSLIKMSIRIMKIQRKKYSNTQMLCLFGS